MKKVILIVLGVLAVIGVGGFLGLKAYLGSFDQVKLQYDKEVISELKRELDFSTFDAGIKTLTDEKVDMMDELLLEKDFQQIQKEVLNGKISCVEVVSYYARRIKKYDGDFNTVIQLNPKAMEEARKLDEKLKNKESIGELFGSVILIKDNIAEKNMNTASGAYALKDLETTRDSFIVEKLKSEDAIIIGKSNLSEWSNFMSMPSSSGFSVLGGQTKNAYGKYDVGGSSSGSSAAAALGFATATLGSETSGSLIFPAGQNSTVAIKPTMGVLSRDLIVPISEAQDTAGVIAKNVQDVKMFFKVAVGYDKNDEMGDNAKQITKEQLDASLNKNFLNGKRIGIMKEESERANKIKKELESLGAEVIDIEINSNNQEIDMMTVLNYGIVHDVKAYLNNEAVISDMKSLSDVFKFNENDPKKRMPFGAKLHQDALNMDITKEKYESVVANNRKVSAEAIDSVMKNNEIIAIVSFSNELSGIYAPAMYPAVTVPSGYKENGEPYGVTFVASLNEDVKLLNIAYSYEQATKHRVNPKLK